MPYDMKTRSGIVLRNIPDTMSPDAPELKQLLAQKIAERDADTPKRDVKGEAAKMALEGEGWGTKALINLGAGFDSALKGAQQLGGMVGLGNGVSDEDVIEKRQRDEALANNTTGGSALQFVGEAAPSMLIPGGAVGGAAAKVGGRVLQKTLPRLIGESAASGAAGAALAPVTSEESRLGNMAVGGALGGAIPVAGRYAGEALSRVTRRGAGDRAARLAREEAGDTVEARRQLADHVMNRSAPDDIPITSAAASQNPGFARLEQGERARNPEHFLADDRDRAQQVYSNVMRDTGDADQLATRRADRSAEWKSNWATAETVADPKVFADRMQQLVPDLRRALRSPEASNPAVRNVLNEVIGEVERLGDDFTPAHLQQIRANLNQRGKFAPTNAYQSAPRESMAVDTLMQEVDNVLNDTTKGAWDAVKSGYEQSSRGVDASKAAGRVRERFLDTETGRTRGTVSHGDVPQITEAGLGRAIDASRGPQKQSLLAPQAERGLNKTLEALRQQNVVQQLKRSSTAGGGSDTVSNLAASALVDSIPIPYLNTLTKFVGRVSERRKHEVLAEALRDPRRMIELLDRATNDPGTITAAEQATLMALRGASTTGATNMMERDHAPQ